uniref:Uncharacterized protein n=1 Tax=Rhipicephalus microplus TaxID=6941 RepID=A0A6M2DAQ2_RHIMP
MPMLSSRLETNVFHLCSALLYMLNLLVLCMSVIITCIYRRKIYLFSYCECCHRWCTHVVSSLHTDTQLSLYTYPIAYYAKRSV